MKKKMLAALGVLGLLMVAGCSTTGDKAPAAEKAATPPPPTPDLSVRETVTATATVRAVDLAARQVTLKGKNGKVFTVKVSDEVRNLPQVKVGDKVVVTYQEALAIQLTGKAGDGIAMRTDTVGAGRAEPGQKPAGVVRDTVKVTANIIAVDKKTRSVIIQGAKRTVTLKVPADFDIGKFKVGDQVQAEYVQELAIRVEPAPAKPVKQGPGYKNKKS